MKELALTSVPSLRVGGDLTKLTADVDQIVTDLAGWVVTEDNIAGTKTKMAEINKIDTAMHTKRKAVAKEYKKDLTVFEDAIKAESVKLIGARTKLADQADVYEQKRKQAKTTECNELLETLLDASELTEDFQKLVTLPEGFANVSMSIGSIKKAIDTSIINAGDKEDEYLRNCITLQNHIDVLNIDNDLANTVKYVSPPVDADFMQLMAQATKTAGDRAKSERLAKEALLKKQEEKDIIVKGDNVDNLRIVDISAPTYTNEEIEPIGTGWESHSIKIFCDEEKLKEILSWLDVDKIKYEVM